MPANIRAFTPSVYTCYYAPPLHAVARHNNHHYCCKTVSDSFNKLKISAINFMIFKLCNSAVVYPCESEDY